MEKLKPRVCVPVRIKPEGGMYTFTSFFQRWLTSNGYDLSTSLADQSDVVIVSSWVTPVSDLVRAKRKNPKLKIVHRIDGSAKEIRRGRRWDSKQRAVNKLADISVFQSAYSRDATHVRGRIIEKDGPVISNPVDLKTYSLNSFTRSIVGSPRVAVVAFSLGAYKGNWRLPRIAQANPQCTFVAVGRFREHEVNQPNIELHGHLRGQEKLEVLRTCHFHLQLSEGDACPNVVLEAMALGLPIIYIPSGGVPELVRDAGIKISDSSPRLPIDELLSARFELRREGRNIVERYHNGDLIFPRYLSAVGY